MNDSLGASCGALGAQTVPVPCCCFEPGTGWLRQVRVTRLEGRYTRFAEGDTVRAYKNGSEWVYKKTDKKVKVKDGSESRKRESAKGALWQRAVFLRYKRDGVSLT